MTHKEIIYFANFGAALSHREWSPSSGDEPPMKVIISPPENPHFAIFIDNCDMNVAAFS
jgi:hypothetical protein